MACFIAARGILGMGLVLNITAAPLLILELAFPIQRVCELSSPKKLNEIDTPRLR